MAVLDDAREQHGDACNPTLLAQDEALRAACAPFVCDEKHEQHGVACKLVLLAHNEAQPTGGAPDFERRKKAPVREDAARPAQQPCEEPWH